MAISKIELSWSGGQKFGFLQRIWERCQQCSNWRSIPRSIHSANFQSECLHPLELMNSIYRLKFESLFPNIAIDIRIFCTIYVAAAEAERSFCKLKLIKCLTICCEARQIECSCNWIWSGKVIELPPYYKRLCCS